MYIRGDSDDQPGTSQLKLRPEGYMCNVLQHRGPIFHVVLEHEIGFPGNLNSMRLLKVVSRADTVPRLRVRWKIKFDDSCVF